MDNLRGAAFMTASMLVFALGDAAIKLASNEAIPQGQIIATFALFGTALYTTLARTRGERVWTRDLLSGPLLLRNGGEVLSTVGFVLAVTLAPLSIASAIIMATPLVVTVGAAIFLGEPVGWRRWAAIAVGLAGVLLVIQPGGSFRPEALFAVLAVFGQAMRDVVTRRVRIGLSAVQISASAFATLIPVGLLMMLFLGTEPVRPSAAAWAFLVAASGFIAGGYVLIVRAMRVGEIGFVTPFRYTRVVFALVLGIALFAERPNALALTGIVVICASGLYTLWRERTLARPAATR